MKVQAMITAIGQGLLRGLDIANPLPLLWQTNHTLRAHVNVKDKLPAVHFEAQVVAKVFQKILSICASFDFKPFRCFDLCTGPFTQLGDLIKLADGDDAESFLREAKGLDDRRQEQAFIDIGEVGKYCRDIVGQSCFEKAGCIGPRKIIDRKEVCRLKRLGVIAIESRINLSGKAKGSFFAFIMMPEGARGSKDRESL